MSDQVTQNAVQNTMNNLGMSQHNQPYNPQNGVNQTSNTFQGQQPVASASSAVRPVGSSQNLVGPSYPSYQQNQTRNTQNPTSNTLNTTKNTQNIQQPNSRACTSNSRAYTSNYLSELAQQAKADLEILIATGKTKDLIGKQLTFNELDNLSEKDLLKYHRIYQSTLASTINDVFSKNAIKLYSKFASLMIPIDNEEKLYEDLRNDYILTTELDRWTGWLALRMGGLAAVVTTSMLTVSHVDFGAKPCCRQLELSSQVPNSSTISSINSPNINEQLGGERDTISGAPQGCGTNESDASESTKT